MGAVGVAALLANATSFALLWAYREGDSNMRSAWVCTRNDVLGNLAVLLAALGVFGTGTGWPDIAVAAIMAALALQGAWTVIGHSWSELRARTRFSLRDDIRLGGFSGETAQHVMQNAAVPEIVELVERIDAGAQRHGPLVPSP